MDKMQVRWYALSIFIGCAIIATATAAPDLEIKPRYSNVCTNDTTCPDNAFCRKSDNGGFCACKTGYILHVYNTTHRICLREASGVGDQCVHNIQCESKMSPRAECFEGQCRCRPGSHFEEFRCYSTSVIGESCTVSHNCYLGPVDGRTEMEAYCVRGFCQCNVQHSPRDGGTRCLKDAMLGDRCEDDNHCTGANTECRETCRCKEDYVIDPQERNCLKAAKTINEECETNAQCTRYLNGTECVTNKCMCEFDHHSVNGKCWKTRLPGSSCSRDEECKMDIKQHGRCVEGVCICEDCEVIPGAANAAIIPKLGLIVFILSLALLKYESL